MWTDETNYIAACSAEDKANGRLEQARNCHRNEYNKLLDMQKRPWLIRILSKKEYKKQSAKAEASKIILEQAMDEAESAYVSRLKAGHRARSICPKCGTRRVWLSSGLSGDHAGHGEWQQCRACGC